MGNVSPDGKFAAFVKFQDGKQSVIVRQISADSEIVIVAPSNLDYFQPTFSNDGETVFYVQIDRGIGTLYKIPTLGGKSEKLVTDIDSPVTFAKDGKSFAFLRHNPNEGGDTIFTANSDGSNLQEFLKSKDTEFDNFQGLAWSPDDEKLLVGVFKGAAADEKKMRTAVINVADKTLTFPGDNFWMEAGEFKWLNDSRHFIFIGKNVAGDSRQVWMMNLSDGFKRQVTNDTSDYASVGISEDENTIIATKVDIISSFWSFAPESNELKQITGENKSLLGNYGVTQMPDGKILYAKRTGGDINIFSMDENGRERKTDHVRQRRKCSARRVAGRKIYRL